MVELRKTDVFVRWIDGLTEKQARGRILARIERLAMGNPGDVAPVGESVSELRIHHGPGYRVYFTRIGKEVVIPSRAATKARRPKTSTSRFAWRRISRSAA